LIFFAPQDSIGTGNNLAYLETGLGIWKQVCLNLGAEFWVNCESFSVTDYGAPIITIEPAEFRRFAVQLAISTRLGAGKLVTWEAMHFFDPQGDEGAQRLRREYLASRVSS